MGKLLSVYRNEMKYWLSYADSVRLQAELQKLLIPDSFSEKDSYMVRSLYFDSINNRDYREKYDGVEKRQKIRLRIYGVDDSTAKFEIKEKNGKYQHKTSLTVTREEAKQIQTGEYGVLLNHTEESALRLYTMLTLGAYRPVAIVEYKRRAFMYTEYNTRVTFDTEVKSSELSLDIYEQEIPFVPVIQDAVILEVKYNEHLLQSISEVLKKYPLTNISISKYGTGRPILDSYITR